MSDMLDQCRALMESMMSGAETWMGGMMPMGGAMTVIGLGWLGLFMTSAIAIAWLIVRGRARNPDAEARQVLDVRYARGELDREAYLRMREELAYRVPAAT